jgi:hypothetical protein
MSSFLTSPLRTATKFDLEASSKTLKIKVLGYNYPPSDETAVDPCVPQRGIKFLDENGSRSLPKEA